MAMGGAVFYGREILIILVTCIFKTDVSNN